MKPLGVKSYGSISHLLGSKLGESDRYIEIGQHNLLTKKKKDKNDVVIVTEKYDGSNVSIAKKDGVIYALTRAGYEAKTSPYKQHHVFDYWVSKNRAILSSILPEGYRLCCEWLLKRHSLEYMYTMNAQISNIVAFDLIDDNNKRVSYLDFINLYTWDIPKARILHIGDSISTSKAMSLLNQDNEHKVQCVDQREGVVYRLERNREFSFAAKFVRSDFEAGKYL